jgi:hypothetical protein
MKDLYTERRPQLPQSYVSFIEHYRGWDGELGNDLGYVQLWKRETIQERYDAYEMAQYLSDRWFPFGSDGGGEMLCFDLSSGNDQVFCVPFIGMSDEEAILQYESFEDIAAAVPKYAEPSDAADSR